MQRCIVYTVPASTISTITDTDDAERCVYFSISKYENSHADNTYEETFCIEELDSSRRHSEW